MRVKARVACSGFPCGDVDCGRHEVPGVEISPGRVRMIVVAEAPPADAADSLYARGRPFHLATTLDAFRAAGLAVSSRAEFERRGIYLTTAVKCAKSGYRVDRATVEACSFLLEREIDLFPAARVIMLMGDVAIGALNSIVRRRTGRRLIPSGPTWKLRAGEYHFEGKRVFPSYLPTGRSYLIERSKREMIAADLRAGLAAVGL